MNTNITANHNQKVTAQRYQPNYCEYKDGYFKDGIFYQPLYAIHHNGELLAPLGVVHSYPYDKAFHILMHLQAISKDDFELKPISWKPLHGFNVDTWGGE
ncbi:hypothetical protein D6D90_01390 [Moraxella catarrhalis]|uniref:hypothetical protein n=1 Tax=Moraxella catarrhalis TaxID=480 RepID=UPI000EA8542D|nr:hypothetical protein [Moraxella catarrhalis]MPW71991.1 hypothetical protein [Moraxella catarrhalis]MPW80540.1 hypothetical protein [Moraxella catarrhalis]MPX04142.1 hypothetical protein [Moraxella catarrhalis]MPX24346.1 hypothetical protein [Moraxella catarrhalis]MPX35302.1 hypothetical protein [Moraxella catarrhalis]